MQCQNAVFVLTCVMVAVWLAWLVMVPASEATRIVVFCCVGAVLAIGIVYTYPY